MSSSNASPLRGLSPADPEASEDPAKILFAEDEVAFRESVAHMLRREGHVVIEVGTAEDAREIALHDEIDLLLMDIQMPGNDGLQIAREIMAARSAPRVVVITGYPSERTAIEGIDLSVDAYLAKPVNFQTISERVGRALEERAKERRHRARLERLESGFQRMITQLRELSSQAEIEGATREFVDPRTLRRLSAREQQVVQAIVDGSRVSEIAASFEISQNTVRNHLRAIFKKLRVRSQGELVAMLRPPTT